MKDNELKNKAIKWLLEQDEINIIRPLRFTPMEVTGAIGGAYSAIGRVKNDVVKELSARGVKIEYIKQNNKRFFQLS